jgi:hypothetical protein
MLSVLDLLDAFDLGGDPPKIAWGFEHNADINAVREAGRTMMLLPLFFSRPI